jgi:predicted glycosyltransferase
MLHNLSNGDGPKSLQRSQRAPRVLIYSHDTFGLGHLRRSRAIANRLVQRNP